MRASPLPPRRHRRRQDLESRALERPADGAREQLTPVAPALLVREHEVPSGAHADARVRLACAERPSVVFGRGRVESLGLPEESGRAERPFDVVDDARRDHSAPTDRAVRDEDGFVRVLVLDDLVRPQHRDRVRSRSVPTPAADDDLVVLEYAVAPVRRVDVPGPFGRERGVDYLQEGTGLPRFLADGLREPALRERWLRSLARGRPLGRVRPGVLADSEGAVEVQAPGESGESGGGDGPQDRATLHAVQVTVVVA